MTISSKSVDSYAAAIMSIFATIVFLFAAPFVEGLGLAGKALAAILTMASLYLVFSGSRYLLLRFALRQVLGYWAYITFPHRVNGKEVLDPKSDIPDAGLLGFGYMCIYIDGAGSVAYEVDLFKNAKSLNQFIDGVEEGEGAIGDAESLAADIDEKNARLRILYHARYIEGGKEDRYGRLFLIARKKNETMDGNWSSEIELAGTLSSGQMRAVRPERFPELAKNGFNVGDNLS